MVRIIAPLFFAIAILVGVLVYQDRVIAQQSEAIRLLFDPATQCPQPPSALTVTVHSLPTAPAIRASRTPPVNSATSAPK